jgi:hypothetical protein
MSRSKVPNEIIKYIELFQDIFVDYRKASIDYITVGKGPAYVDFSKRVLINPRQLQKDFDYLEKGGKINIGDYIIFSKLPGDFRETKLQYLKEVLDHEVAHLKYNELEDWLKRSEAMINNDHKTYDTVNKKMEDVVHQKLQQKEGGNENISFLFLKDLRGNISVPKQTILELFHKAKKEGLSNYAQKIVEDTLKEFGDKQVNVQNFLNSIQNKNKYLILSTSPRANHFGMQFSKEAKNYIEKNKHKYVENVYRLPFSYDGNILANNHYKNLKDYFGHIRGFVKDDTLYVNELQSDLIQGAEYKRVQFKNIDPKKALEVLNYLEKTWERRLIQELIVKKPENIKKIAFLTDKTKEIDPTAHFQFHDRYLVLNDLQNYETMALSFKDKISQEYFYKEGESGRPGYVFEVMGTGIDRVTGENELVAMKTNKNIVPIKLDEFNSIVPIVPELQKIVDSLTLDKPYNSLSNLENLKQIDTKSQLNERFWTAISPT